MLDAGTQTTFGAALNSLNSYKSECESRHIPPIPSLLATLTSASKKEDPVNAITIRDSPISRAQCKAIAALISASKNSFIHILDFEGSLKEDTAEIILESARQTSTLNVLNLRNCKALSMKSCSILSEMIKNGHPLRVLDISFNHIDSSGLQCIGKALASSFCHLEILKMNGITSNSSVATEIQFLSRSLVANTTLLSLALGENQLTAQSADFISMFLKDTIPLPPFIPIQMQEREKKNREQNDKKIEGKEDNSEYEESLNRKKNEKEIEQLHMKSITPTKSLDEGCLFTSQLASLDLRNNNIGDDGALKLSFCLKTNRTLLSLILWATHLSPVGIGHLCNGLMENLTLQHFDVGSNTVGFEGSKYLGELLTSNSTLTTLGIASSEICSDDLIFITHALSTNRTLLRIDLRRNHRLSLKGIQELNAVLEPNTVIQCICFDSQQLIEKAKEGTERHAMQSNIQAIQQTCERNVHNFIRSNSAPKPT